MLRRFQFNRYLLLGACFSLWGLASLEFVSAAGKSNPDRPNILWITSEDNGPELGCYGDTYADSPNIDQLAAEGLRFETCWSNAPVCAPARTTIISGMYPPSLGAEHMRSLVPLPAGFKMYPQYLREAGYYCTNRSKEDYNLIKPDGVWDASSRKADWKNRADGQPFFAVINHTISHESQLRKRPHTAIHDPADVTVPAYHPDTPEVRQDWAQYYDKVTEMDALVGKNIAELKKAGVYEDTIIFYYGDHGSGMPRHKRWPYNSGLHVPLIVRFPEKYQHLAPPEYSAGTATDRLVSFVDLAPTLLSICGIEPPEPWQGHAFAGKFVTDKQPYIYGFRGRMDERIDMVRSVRNERFVYIRHFYPHRPYGQYLNYMFQTPTTQVWYDLHLKGKLTPQQDQFWLEKPVEELYDLQTDPDEVVNLIGNEAYQSVANELSEALGEWMVDILDLGVFPEAELHAICGDRSAYDVVRDDDSALDVELRMLDAVTASETKHDPNAVAQIRDWMDDDAAVRRYWSCIWALKEKQQGVAAVHSQLLERLDDPSPSVRIVAAEALGRFGSADDLKLALPVLVEAADLQQSDVYTAIAAWNSLDFLDEKAASVRAELQELPSKLKKMPPRVDSYIPRLKEKTLADLDEKPLP